MARTRTAASPPSADAPALSIISDTTAMRYVFGRDFQEFKKNPSAPEVQVAYDTANLVNPHAGVFGMTGAGKTHTLKALIRSMCQVPDDTELRVHVFDVHDDINIPDASEVTFSEQDPYGLNPLYVNPDRRMGGVNRSIKRFIATVNKCSPTKLGINQVTVLTNLLLDVYALRGFYHDDPTSWHCDSERAQLLSDGSDNRLYLDVPHADKDDAKAFDAKWDNDKRCWYVFTHQYEGGITRWFPKTIGKASPVLDDVIVYAERIVREAFLGTDQEALTLLEVVNKKAQALQQRQLDAIKAGRHLDDTVEDAALDKAKGAAIEAYTRYAQSVRTGREFENAIKYGSSGGVKEVADRLKTLRATGLFKWASPPFDPRKQVWTYKLKSLDIPEQKMFVLFRLQELYTEALMRGESHGKVRHVFVLDEVHRYADDDEESILNVLSRESRKFGVALIACNQDADIPKSFMAALGTKIILGIDDQYWKSAVSKMSIDENLLKWIKFQRTIAVQLKEKTSTSNDWRWVVLPGVNIQPSKAVAVKATA
jgi:hypothetical protein